MLYATAGVHPHHAASFAAAGGAAFRELLARPEVVAVGECGLDYYRDFSPRTAQRAAFIAQLEIAVDVRKPVFLHQRDAHEDFAAILARLFGCARAAASRTASPAARLELEAYLALGLAIGVTGWVCDERRGERLREAVPQIPVDRLLLETDAPYLLPRDLAPKPASQAQRARISCRTSRARSRRCAAKRSRTSPPPPPATRGDCLDWPVPKDR